MQSYQAARSYFSVLSFLSWCVIVLGGLVAIVALLAIGQMSRNFGGSPLAGLTGVLPGAAIMFAGFMGLVLVQIGRAGVDTAELTQQGLKVARDQLEVSKQSLKKVKEFETGFASLNAAGEAASGASRSENSGKSGTGYGSQTTGNAGDIGAAIGAEAQPYSAPSDEVTSLKDDGSLLEYRGRQLLVSNGNYSMNGIGFSSLERAKHYIDQLKIPASREHI